jgi:AraC-like DNA-binding protein
LSPAEYRTRKRVHVAKKLLRESNMPITTISHDLGFASSQYFATVFKNYTGMKPKEYRHSGTARGMVPKYR